MIALPFDLAPTQYLGLFAGGRQIGTTVVNQSTRDGFDVSESKTRLKLALQGTPLDLEVDAATYSVNGSVRRMTFVQRSGGRSSECRAEFGEKTVEIELRSDVGATKRTVPRPAGAVVDDPVAYLMAGGASAKTFYVLDPTAGTFVKNVARLKGPARVTVGPVTSQATKIVVEDPRMSTTVYLSAKGDFLKASTPLGIETLPISKADAESPLEGGAVDLATVTSLSPDKPILNAPELTRLRLKITGVDLASIPSGGHQAAKRVAGGWLVDVKPSGGNATSLIGAVGKASFIEPSAYLPSDDPALRAEAARLVFPEKRVLYAALRIRREVYRQMKPNAGIGVLRDAREVFATKEGVCRDYAVLTATLMRAAGIPTRLATGLVTWDSTFYYHAWVEVWDGTAWIGMDSAAPGDRISAGHVKLAEGNADRAFVFPVLGRARIAVLAQATNKGVDR